MAKVKRTKQEYPGISVYRRGDLGGSWAAQWRDPVSGKKQQTLLTAQGYATKAEAHSFLKELSDRLLEKKRLKTLGNSAEEIESQERGQTLLTTVISDFEKKFGEPKSKVVVDVQSRLKPFKEWLQGPGIAYALGRDFNKLALTGFHDWLQARKKQRAQKGVKKRGAFKATDRELSPATKNVYRSATIAFLNWARRRSYISMAGSDISETFEKFKVEKKRPPKLIPAELSRFLSEAIASDRELFHGSRNDKSAYYTGEQSPLARPRFLEQTPFVLFLTLTGFRRGEALHLRWENVDLKRGTIRVQSDPVSGWKVKTRSERDIGLKDSPALKRLLEILKKRTNHGDYVLCGEDGSRPRDFHRPSWVRFAAKAKLHRATPKLLRSTFASALAGGQGGPSPYVLAARMGHTVEVAQEHYIDVTETQPGSTVEEWLGVAEEIRSALKELEARGNS